MENLNGPYSSWYDGAFLKGKKLVGRKKIMRKQFQNGTKLSC